jgi:hypothetical protein
MTPETVVWLRDKISSVRRLAEDTADITAVHCALAASELRQIEYLCSSAENMIERAMAAESENPKR